MRLEPAAPRSRVNAGRTYHIVGNLMSWLIYFMYVVIQYFTHTLSRCVKFHHTWRFWYSSNGIGNFVFLGVTGQNFYEMMCLNIVFILAEKTLMKCCLKCSISSGSSLFYKAPDYLYPEWKWLKEKKSTTISYKLLTLL